MKSNHILAGLQKSSKWVGTSIIDIILSNLFLVFFRDINNNDSPNLDEDCQPSKAVLYHYFLVWLSIITSPKGHQLDIWLVIILIMDCVPILMSLYHTAQYVVRSQTDPWQYDPHSVFWSLTSSMRSWSPAYQLNSLIMHYVEGCLIKHVYILFMFTLTVTQLHRWIVSNLYCVRL